MSPQVQVKAAVGQVGLKLWVLLLRPPVMLAAVKLELLATQAEHHPVGLGAQDLRRICISGFNVVKLKLHPKTAEILANRRAHGSSSLRSYYGPLDVLENQSTFDVAGIRWNDMF